MPDEVLHNASFMMLVTVWRREWNESSLSPSFCDVGW